MLKIPTYQAVLNSDEDGITTISFVTNPATQIDMICFSDEDKNKLQFADDEKRMVTSVVMLADTKIYRYSNGFEYYITYSKETLLKMCEKMLKDNTFNTISFEHDGNVIENGKISLVELYTTDEHKKSPFNVPDGSIIAVYKVNDNNIWDLFKTGEVGGISLEGYFEMEPIKFEQSQKYKKHKNMLKKVKTALMSLLLQYSEVKTDNGILYYEGDELVEGIVVTDENEEPVADGDYVLEDGTIVTIKDSKVETIVIPEVEVEPEVSEELENEGTEDETETEQESETDVPEVEEKEEDENPLTAEVEALKAEIETLKTEIETLKETINEIANTPAAQPVAEEFKQATEIKENKAAKLASFLHS